MAQGRPARVLTDAAPDGVFERLHARAGRWYLHLLLISLALGILLIGVPAYSLVLIPYFGASSNQYGTVVLAFALSFAFAGLGCVGIGLRRHRAVTAWLDGKRGPAAAEAVWGSIVGDLPRTVVLIAGWYAILCVPPALYVSDLIGLSAAAAAGYCILLWICVGGSSVAVYLVFEQAFRPLTREAALDLSEAFESRHRPVSLGAKVLILFPTISLYTSMLVAAVSGNSSSLEGRIALTVVTALGLNATLALGLTLMLRRSLIGRLDDLRRGMGQVDRGDLTPQLLRLAGDELDDVGRSFNQMVRGLREREALHGALGSYVSADLADRIATRGAIVDGEQLEVTVLFVDIRDFTWLVDHSEPAETVAYLNDFFETVLPVVTRHGGHPNKLLGDGLLAVFGAPVALPDHAGSALSAAQEILEVLYARFDGELRVGIGLNSGPVIAGTVGGPGKLDYTVIGDTVNVAARVEQLTKETGDPLLVTEATRNLLGDAVVLEDRGRHRLRGKSRDITVFAVEVSLPESRRR